MEILLDDQDHDEQRIVRLNTTIGYHSCAVQELYLAANRAGARLVRSNTTDNEPEIFTLNEKEADTFVEAYTKYKRDQRDRDNAYLNEATTIASKHNISIRRDESENCWRVDKGYHHLRTPRQLLDRVKEIAEPEHPF